MRLLDRYILKNCLVPFVYCFFGFLAIWLVFDLSDNGQDFIEARVPLTQIAYYYATQFPQIMVLSLPISLLLALLYCLSRMSRSNEIMAMLAVGISVPRLLVPLMGLGIAATGMSLLLNYRLAPQSEAVKERVFQQIVKGEDNKRELKTHLFRDRIELRTWFIGETNLDTMAMEKLHIMQQDPKGDVVRKIYARRANYLPEDGVWKMRDGKTVEFDQDGNIVSQNSWDDRTYGDWPETPERILSSLLTAQHLSVQELKDYLRYNSDFPESQLAKYRTQLHYRWALPWSCFLVVFVAAPLGIVFSRRGVMAGVASSIFIFASMLFIAELFRSLGEGARVSPVVAAWVPNLIFAAIGIVLLYFRTTNREIRLSSGRLRAPARQQAAI